MAGEIRPALPTERPARPGVGRIRTFSSLRNRDYRFLWIGNTFNSGANWLQQLTVGWLVWDLSQSPFLVGTVGGLRAFPFLLIGPFAGVMADRLDRRKVVMLSQTVLAVAALLFALVVAYGRVQVWHAFAYIIISGTAHSILQPARSALVANTVPREDLANAFALQSMSVTASRFVWRLLAACWSAPSASSSTSSSRALSISSWPCSSSRCVLPTASSPGGTMPPAWLT